ncbi:hypothetical protein [Chitinophaga sp. MM2321]|uniref:hypothetical protein n=1 Tax=Chitinophaga sp. MM2321 TaxID=3137178 RepID=UPI0032D578B8
MRVLHIAAGKYQEASVSLLQKGEWTGTLKKRFDFDWEKEEQYEVYKITVTGDNSIQGLMSLLTIAPELRLEIRLLESARENIGSAKVYDRIAGCLIAFACKLAFKRGFGGFVSLVPKTELIAHYIAKYNFFPQGKHLAIDGDASFTLITEYLENDSK